MDSTLGSWRPHGPGFGFRSDYHQHYLLFGSKRLNEMKVTKISSRNISTDPINHYQSSGKIRTDLPTSPSEALEADDVV